MNIFLSRWLRRPAQRRTGGAAALRAAALAELTAACDAAGTEVQAEERPRGCGWFDSSHDLQRGLWVCEQPEIEQIVAGLPLEPWLELHLAGWQPRVPG